MPQDHSDVAADLYEGSLAIGRQAIDAGLFEVAFHALSAALHCAERLEDVARVQAIDDVARETQQRIDREHPDHRIGSRAASDRGHTPLFNTLSLHAQALAARLRGVDAVASANRVSGLERHPGRHTSDTPPQGSGGTSTA